MSDFLQYVIRYARLFAVLYPLCSTVCTLPVFAHFAVSTNSNYCLQYGSILRIDDNILDEHNRQFIALAVKKINEME